jgi:uncharacterized protein with NAD-binding domain and iron-sulfur cluster
MPQQVCIIGGGVAGLTAAHELKERGFRVTVFERREIFGGKARSGVVRAGPGVSDAIVGLPSEHGFRFFPGFYRHLIDTMRRIPAAHGRDRRVLDDLIEVRESVIAQAAKRFCLFPTKSPTGISGILRFFREVLANPSLGLGAGEAAFAAIKLATAMTTCDERRDAELDYITWWNYMRADDMSENYRRVVINGLTRNFVAMHAEQTSLRTAITILARLLQDFISDRGLDRVLNGPTSEVWIDPWVDYLKSDVTGQFPVTFRASCPVGRLLFEAQTNRIGGLQGQSGKVLIDDSDCLYIAAIPVEAMVELLHNSPGQLLQHSPILKLLSDNHLQVNWMSGVLYYLKSDAPMAPGHVIYLDSGWAITSISQNQFWAKKVQSYGDGTVNGTVSAIISDWLQDGTGGVLDKPARSADNSDQVAAEALAEIRAHIEDEPRIDLSAGNIVDHYLDSDIVFSPEILKRVTGLRPAAEFVSSVRRLSQRLGPHRFMAVKNNLEPLFINTVGSLVYRPTEATDIENLFLAADYVRTNTDLATMEGANEAARRAVNRILNVLQLPGRRCRIFEFNEPIAFAPARAFDRFAFELGLPHPGI